MSKKKDTKRLVHVECFDSGDGFVLDLSKAVAVKTKQRMIHFDELPDGTWRLIYNGDHIPDFAKIKAFNIVREGDDERRDCAAVEVFIR